MKWLLQVNMHGFLILWYLIQISNIYKSICHCSLIFYSLPSPFCLLTLCPCLFWSPMVILIPIFFTSSSSWLAYPFHTFILSSKLLPLSSLPNRRALGFVKLQLMKSNILWKALFQHPNLGIWGQAIWKIRRGDLLYFTCKIVACDLLKTCHQLEKIF